jgi:hypothetical protein
MSSVNLLGNGISNDQALVLASILKVHTVLKSLCGNNSDEMELDMSGKNISAAEATMLAAEIAGNGALLVLSLKNNSLFAGGGKALAAGLKGNQGITKLDISENYVGVNSDYGVDTSGIIAIADAIPDMRALSSLNLASNNLGELVPPEGWEKRDSYYRPKQCLQRDGGNWTKAVPDGAKPQGIIAIANVIQCHPALSVLSLKSNNLQAAGGKALAEGLKGNQVITKLDISSNNLGQKGYDADNSGIIALADAIPDMGALSSLSLANNNIGKLIEENGWTAVYTDTYEQGQIVEGNYKQSGKWYPGKVTDVTDGMYSITYDDGDEEANVAAELIKSPGEDKEVQWQHTDGRQQDSKPAKQALGVIALANAIPDMGAILSVNLLKNKIGVDQAKALASILKEHPTLKSLCGNSGEETELDMSGKGMDAEDAIILVPEIVDNGVLIKLDISNNCIGAEQTKGLQRICVASGIDLAM